MSAPIRSVLTVAVQKARLNLQTANDLLANNGATLVNLASASEMLGKKFRHTGAAKTTEEDIFDQYAPGGDTPGEIIVILSETIGQLDMRIDQIRASQPNRHPNPNGVNPAPPNHHHHIPLPPMSLMDFDGTPSRYEQFWTNFRDNVDQRPDLSPAQKLRYLMGQLKGAARDLSIGIRLHQFIAPFLRGGGAHLPAT
ncbi:hypothetical protein niasHS_001508 [Heterodera schachtii]|uniref:Uncharacterized protein n=1 Tax=Heterodera schachtii TaxID=97005 RepID=A0ABD2KEA9_HETSC